MCDAKAAVSLALYIPCMTNKVSYLILCDETIGLDWLLPLEEDHVIQRGEGQGLRSNASRNYSGKRKNNLLWNKHSAAGLELMDSCAGMPGGKNTFDRRKKHRGRGRDGAGWKRSSRKTELKGGDERKLWTGLLSALRMNWDSGFYCLIIEHHVLQDDSQFFFLSTLLTKKQQSNPTCDLTE